MDRCLVTGATGFIGGRLAERLSAEGRVVRCLVRARSDTSRLERLGVELVVGDLCDPGSLQRAVVDCRWVLHCAAMVSDWGTVEEITRVNVTGTRELAMAAAQAGAERLVQVSTTDVYGHPGTAEVDENARPAGFCNWYAQTKLLAEAEVRRAAAAGRLEVVILRPATVYGPGSVEVVLEVARAIRAGTMILIAGGRAVAGLCYVDNLVDAAVIALRHEGAAGEAFNITDGLDVTWRRLTDDLADGLGCRRVRWSVPFGLAHGLGFGLEQGYRVLRSATGLRTRPLLSRQAVQVMGIDQSFSNRKARERLGWEPRVQYDAGLEATLLWLSATQASPSQ